MNHIDILEAADQYYLASITWRGKKCAFFILPGTVLACTDGWLPNHISGDLQFFIDLLISIILIVILFISIIIIIIIPHRQLHGQPHGYLHGHLHAINGYHPHNIPDHIHDNHCDQGDLHEPSDSDYEHNNARSPRQEAALLEVCESRHLADDDDLG